jgi:hemoglobin-like flavoprotein
MTNEVTYTTVMNLTSSWDMVKLQKDYQDRAGELIFQRLFEIEPGIKNVFGFQKDDDFRQNDKFAIHARTIVDMIDCVIALLGPDLDILTDQLYDLGKRHINYGVKAEHLPVMGKAVIYSLEIMLGSKFSMDDMRDWATVFKLMSDKMVEGLRSD